MRKEKLPIKFSTAQGEPAAAARMADRLFPETALFLGTSSFVFWLSAICAAGAVLGAAMAWWVEGLQPAEGARAGARWFLYWAPGVALIRAVHRLHGRRTAEARINLEIQPPPQELRGVLAAKTGDSHR